MNATNRPPPGPLSVREPWDRVSAGYAEDATSVMLPFTRDAIALAKPSPEARVLDVATGPGILALEVAPAVARVDALDFSAGMLERLEAKRRALNIDNVFAREGDGQALPYEAASFDAAFSMFGLMFFPDRLEGFRELFRVLRSGGVAVVSSWAPVDQSPFMQLMFGALCAADPTRAAPRTNLASLENPELFSREFAAAGFSDVRVAPYTHAIRVESAEDYWESMSRASAPIVMLRHRLGAEEWKRQSAVARAYLAERIQGPCDLTTTAYLGFGRRP